jgi:hypothetical protein
MQIRPIFAWYDIWVGFFIDRVKRRLYFFPIPCLGFVLEWGRPKAPDPRALGTFETSARAGEIARVRLELPKDRL